ncbi:MAG: hypothetical protein FWF57_06335 [Defluviitaleaceae bacterium]|nr:hypothetical protein [Defluviitaleaceae bacterium]
MENKNYERNLLGNWILREVLKLPPRTLITKEILDKLEIDSIILTKERDDYFHLDFAKSGSFENFKSDTL